MASNSGVQQPQVQHFQQPNSSPHHCKECGLYLNSAESLEVHLQYHKENLLNKWATQATSQSEETNNNTTKTIKREFIQNTISAPADSSDSMLKKSPDYGNRTSPENNFGHPPTPQSYHSASSPYQNPENPAFSPGFQSYQTIKAERLSPATHYQQNYPNYTETQFYSMDNAQIQPPTGYPQEFSIHKLSQNSFRYHPYQQTANYDRSSQAQVSSSSPAYPPQPTPSPSPKQCDKCGFVCDSSQQLVDHVSVAHPSTPVSHLPSYQHQAQHFLFGTHSEIKSEEDAQSEILDLDSHKVHQVYTEEEKRQNGEMGGHNPHSVSAMLSSWHHPQQQRVFMNGPEQKIYQNGGGGVNDPKLFQPHQIVPGEFLANGVTTTTQESGGNNVSQTAQTYRSFEHIPQQSTAAVISSTQVPNIPAVSNGGNQKGGANWKSNEARRPKTYNCTACNKWFTSSGHLKRHYNTTLHKNAVKSSGQPDPAALPISAHHHPGRDNVNRGEGHSPVPEELRGEDSSSQSVQGHLQQPPNGPYDRQTSQSLLHNSPLPPSHNMTNSASPNGEAGLSATTSSLDTRGLLSFPTAPTTPGFSMATPMMQMENTQFQMYPNGLAPHVTQLIATSNLNTTGELLVSEPQPLPGFEQFQTSHRYGVLLSYGNGNVGGSGPVTAPYSTAYFSDEFQQPEPRALVFKDDDDYKVTVLTTLEPAILPDQQEPPYSPPNHNNNLTELQLVDIDPQPMTTEKNEQVILKNEEYEESTGSPHITSTVQAKQPGIHKCFDCDKMFNKVCYLTQHNKTFHSGDKPFKCTRCGKRFSCEKQHQSHLTKHAGDKPYKCELCPKQFNHKTDLRRHMCLHTGQKPYACDTCGKGFIRKDHMIKHCETHTRKPNSAKITVVR